jgi:hypothetical protein
MFQAGDDITITLEYQVTRPKFKPLFTPEELREAKIRLDEMRKQITP